MKPHSMEFCGTHHIVLSLGIFTAEECLSYELPEKQRSLTCKHGISAQNPSVKWILHAINEKILLHNGSIIDTGGKPEPSSK